MKTQLEQRPGIERMRLSANGRIIPWVSCLPFVENSRGMLVHRPRFVCTHKIGPKWPAHIAINCWCGNTMTGNQKFTFLDAPQESAIVCARCEDNAVAAGLMPSSAIVGRHVHTGGVIAKTRCCEDET
jgi:hypothetical protein